MVAEVSNEITALEYFCGSKHLWEYYKNESANLTHFDLSPCFEKTILAWTPIVFLWLFLPLEYFYTNAEETKKLYRLNWLCKTKLGLTYLLIFLSSLTCLSLTFPRYWQLADLISSIMSIPTFVLVRSLTLKNTQCGFKSSGVLFIFWLLSATLPVHRLNRILHIHVRQNWDIPSFLFVASWVTACICLIINFFPETEENHEEPIEMLKMSKKKVSKLNKERSKLEKQGSRPNKEKNYSFPCRVLFMWMFPFIKKGSNCNLTPDDLWKLSSENSLESTYREFEDAWDSIINKQNNQEEPKYQEIKKESTEKTNNVSTFANPVALALLKAFWKPFLFASLLKLLHSILMILHSVIMNELVTVVYGSSPLSYIYSLVGLTAFTAILYTLVKAQQEYKLTAVDIRVQSTLRAAIYSKATSISPVAETNKSLGDLVNLCAVDVTLILDMIRCVNELWSVPFIIGGCLFYLWPILGPSMFGGVLFLMVAVLVNAVITYFLAKIYTRQMRARNSRTKLTYEVLGGFKVVKLNNWEESMEEKILKFRKKETNLLKVSYYLQALSALIVISTYAMLPLVIFEIYVKTVGDFSYDKFMSASVFFITITNQMSLLPGTIAALSQGQVSLKRIYDYLTAKDLSNDAVTYDDDTHGDVKPNNSKKITTKNAVTIENGCFAWKKDPKSFCLEVTELKVEEGSLVMVVGSVGSGKSSLLSAILGEMNKHPDSSVNVKGSVAYVPQQAWLQNTTVEQNIKFSHDECCLDIADNVLEACGLEEDFNQLPKREKSEVGEQGGCLSGGQKQRVNLARAVNRMHGTNVYLLDDPLSAVDANVAKHIFERVIGPNGLLKHKTRIMTTQSTTFLKYADKVILMENGRIVANGILEAVQVSPKGQDFFRILQKINQNNDETLDAVMPESIVDHVHTEESSSEQAEPTESDFGSTEALIKEERLEKGNVKGVVYMYYLRSIGWCAVSLICLLTIVHNTVMFLIPVYLQFWGENMRNKSVISPENMIGLFKYSNLSLVYALVNSVSQVVVFTLLLNASQRLHKHMLRGVLRSPVSFMDANPVGRVLARFAQDMEILDFSLPMKTFMFFFNTIEILLVILVNLFLDKGLWFGFAGLFALTMYILIVMMYLKTSRQLRRLESVTRSPVFSHLKETYLGAPVIRAFKARERFFQEFKEKVDRNQQCNYLLIMSQLFANLWMDILGQLIALAVVVYTITHSQVVGEEPDQFMIFFAVTITPWILRLIMQSTESATEVHTDIVAVERAKEYKNLPSEEYNDIAVVPAGWPSHGEVRFNNVTAMYHSSRGPVLFNLNFVIQPGQKVGIVGRTGAGKSTIALVLLRIIEVLQVTQEQVTQEQETHQQSLEQERQERERQEQETQELGQELETQAREMQEQGKAQIFIDGVDISTIPLSTLRTSVTVIPQDPVLFTGTLRMNLDPKGKRSDDCDDIWIAAKDAHLHTCFQIFDRSLLDLPIEDSGSTLSVGQKQLICLARALLRKPKVLILDEATAAVDPNTEELIHQTIAENFRGCTVLTIAHRLNIVMDHDVVMVIDKGHLIESGEPNELKKDKSSIFYKLVNKSTPNNPNQGPSNLGPLNPGPSNN